MKCIRCKSIEVGFLTANLTIKNKEFGINVPLCEECSKVFETEISEVFKTLVLMNPTRAIDFLKELNIYTEKKPTLVRK